MFSQCTVLIVTLGLAAGFAIRGDVTRTRRDAPYRGPPAPLNHDGTVAFTPEFLQANDIHNAAYAEAYQRLKAAEDLAAAHPDRTSPPSKDYNPQDIGQYNHQDNGQYASQQEDDGQYKPHLYEKEATQQYSSPSFVQQQHQVSYDHGAFQQHYNPTAYNAASYQPTTQHSQQQYNTAPYQHTTQHSQQQYNTAPYQHTTQHTQQQYNAAPQNPQPFVPAPLNPDGTVAHTPEYLALAASLHNSVHQAVTRHRRSLNLYHGPPAPLNHDGTVANTPEIEHAIAFHKAAYAQEYQKLQAAAQSYGSYEEDDGQYKPHLYDEGYYNSHQESHHHNNDQHIASHYNQEPSYSHYPKAHIPAPLNHDGTVAHTAEYKAVAAAHQAEFEKALQNVKHLSFSPHTSLSQSHW